MFENIVSQPSPVTTLFQIVLRIPCFCFAVILLFHFGCDVVTDSIESPLFSRVQGLSQPLSQPPSQSQPSAVTDTRSGQEEGC